MKKNCYLHAWAWCILLLVASCTNSSTTASKNVDTLPVDTVSVIDTVTGVSLKNLENVKAKASDLKNLIALSRVNKDEFSESTFYYAKSTTKYVDVNSIHSYLSVTGGVPNPRFCIQYAAENWLFIKKAIFNIDGKNYEYYVDEMNRDNGSGKIWEWMDTYAGEPEMELIEALADAKSVKVKYIGTDYYKVKIIPKSQLNALKHVLKLYKSFMLQATAKM